MPPSAGGIRSCAFMFPSRKLADGDDANMQRPPEGGECEGALAGERKDGKRSANTAGGMEGER